jgi:hypothetical protein
MNTVFPVFYLSSLLAVLTVSAMGKCFTLARANLAIVATRIPFVVVPIAPLFLVLIVAIALVLVAILLVSCWWSQSNELRGQPAPVVAPTKKYFHADHV